MKKRTSLKWTDNETIETFRDSVQERQKNAPETYKGRMKYRKKYEQKKEHRRQIDESLVSASASLEPHYWEE